MLTRKAEEELADVLVNRINKANAEILQQIGMTLKSISTLNVSKARQLQQILRYSGDYNKIVNILSQVSGKSVEEIQRIFEEIAKTNKQFAKEFYKYRDIGYIPYKNDIPLQRQVLAMSRITSELYVNISQATNIGLIVDGRYRPLKQAYRELIDKAITTVVQGKQDYYTTMRDTIRELGSNGVIVYDSTYVDKTGKIRHRKRRLDSAVKMNIMQGIRDVNNETNRIFGEEYGADGIEITVHDNPAPDHEDVQGMQFYKTEFDKLQNSGVATNVDGDEIDIHNGKSFRPISHLNCYHETMNIIVGVNRPQYSKEQLKEIKENNHKGFDFEGKHYTMYEGTQLQRLLELKIRRLKEEKIIPDEINDVKEISRLNAEIKLVRNKYNDLCNASGLKARPERMRIFR